MRNFSLFFMVLTFSALPQRVLGLYDTELISLVDSASIGGGSRKFCRNLSPTCPASGVSASVRNAYQIASVACRAEQQKLKCADLTIQEPELQHKIRDCSEQALCEESQFSVPNTIKGCFWNAPGSWGTDAWSSIRDSIRDSANETYKRIHRFEPFFHPLQFLWGSVPILEIEDIQKAKDLPFQLYNGGKNWLDEKQVKLQCYNRQSQAELLCYGVLNVFAPGAALKAAANVPKIINLLKLSPVKKVERTIGDAVNQTKRGQINQKTMDSFPVANRQNFIAQNMNLNLTSVEQNERWIKLAGNVRPDGKTKFFEVENSFMKELNDTTQDKNFVTAITNKNKIILSEKLKRFEAAHPELEMHLYSDFKSVRVALKPRPPLQHLPDRTQDELATLFQESNDEFASFMRNENLVRTADQPQEWFRAGFGETADQATLASRYSRNSAGENKLRNFKDPDLHENLQTSLKATEMYRRDLQKELASTGTMESIGTSEKMTFKKEVFEAVRKTTSDAELKMTFEKSFGVSVTDTQAMKIRDYSALIDDFSPGIHVAKKQVATLSQSPHGGLSIDFSGLGAENLRATAVSLSRSNKIDDAVIETRLGEKSVSRSFLEKKQIVQESVQKVLEKNGIKSEVLSSGDDMVIRPASPIPPQVRTEIAKSIAEKINPSAVRISHVPNGVIADADRMLIGTHGETLEKLTRKNLQGELSREKLNQVLLMVDMQSSTAGKGSAKLIMESGKANLNQLEQQKIKKAFDQAIKEMNLKLQQDNLPANYKSAG